MKKIEKIKNWVKRNKSELISFGVLMGATYAICIWNYKVGEATGYAKGLAEFRKEHCDLVNKVIDIAGCQSCLLTLDVVYENKEKVIAALNNNETIYDLMEKVHDDFYEIEEIESILDSVKDA